MELSKIESKQDLLDCVQLYYDLNDHTFLDVDINICYTNLSKLYKQNSFLRVIREDSKIIAWLLAIEIQSLHMAYPQFQQLYYASNQTGMTAYKCVVILHEAMVEEAKRLKINICLSQGSHMDSKNTFARILEKQGWDRRGHTAALKLVQPGPSLPLLATFFRAR